MKPETALKKIRKAVFPPVRVARDGTYVCNDAIGNLEGAIYDLKRLKADKVCIGTVERVQRQLIKVQKILDEAGI